MGMIGRWIDERCAAEPDVMRRVLGRRFGNLDYTIVEHEGTECAGCLVGSWMLERGTRREGADYWGSHTEEVSFQVSRLTHWGRGESWHRNRRKHPDIFVIRLLKQRIRKALGLAPVPRELAVVTPAQEPPK